MCDMACNFKLWTIHQEQKISIDISTVHVSNAVINVNFAKI